MLIVTALLVLLGLGLLALGRWGSRDNLRVSSMPGLDARTIQRRRAVLRRGAYACYVAGVAFVLLAVVSLFVRVNTVNCPSGPKGCAPAGSAPASAPAGSVPDRP